MAWDQARIDAGDEVAAANQADPQPRTSTSSASAGPSTTYRPALQARRVADLPSTASTCPSTSPAPGRTSRPAAGSPHARPFDPVAAHRVHVFNGHHPDGYSPDGHRPLVRVPVVLRGPPRAGLLPEWSAQLAPAHVRRALRLHGQAIEADRFAHLGDDFDAALARYEAEPPVRSCSRAAPPHEVAGRARPPLREPRHLVPAAEVPLRRWLGAGARRIAASTPAPPRAPTPTTTTPTPARALRAHRRVRRLHPAHGAHRVDPLRRRARARYEIGSHEPVTVVGQGHLDLWLRPAPTTPRCR